MSSAEWEAIKGLIALNVIEKTFCTREVAISAVTQTMKAKQIELVSADAVIEVAVNAIVLVRGGA